MQENTVVKTTVSQVDADIQDIFNLAGPAGKESQQPASKPNIFSRDGVDLGFLETPAATLAPAATATPASSTSPEAGSTQTTNQEPATSIEDLLADSPADSGAAGTPSSVKPDKGGMAETFGRLITAGKLAAFDDEKPLTDYSSKDFEELLEANLRQRDEAAYEQVSKDFFQSLPPELQYAARYVLDGGKDLKGLFQSLSASQINRELNPDEPADQETIYRQYLQAINFGSTDEIDEEIRTWKDLGQLDKKAKQAHPKLTKLHEQQVSQQLQQQETARKQQEAAAQQYVENVYKALEPGQLSGLKLDKKTQSFLYHSMTQAQYPSLTGNNTNLLGHLLEKYQFVEPNYPLVVEALWLLSDPQGYRTKLIENGASQEVAKTVRTLKTEESRKQVGQLETSQESTAAPTRKLPRPGNIFRRN